MEDKEKNIDPSKAMDNHVRMTGYTIGYVAWYKKHYVIVKISPIQCLVVDEEGNELLNKVPNNVQQIMDDMPKLVAAYIEQKYYNSK